MPCEPRIALPPRLRPLCAAAQEGAPAWVRPGARCSVSLSRASPHPRSCARKARRRSASARSTATPPSPPSPCPIATAGSWRSSRSTPPAACSAASSRSSAATTPASRRTRSGSPASWSTTQKVDLLAGGFLSNVGLALSATSRCTNKKLFVAGEPLTDALVWDKGNRTCYRLRPSHLHAGRDAGRRTRRSCRRSAGRRWRRTTNTASPR